MRRCLEGDAESVERLVQQYYAPLVHFISRYTGLRHSAEDLAQEVLLKVLRSLDSFDERASLRTWIFAVAVNACRDEIRRIQRRREVLVSGAPERALGSAVGAEDGPEQFLEQNLRAEAVRQAVESLSAPQREAIILRFYHGLSLQEIGAICGCSVGTVGSRLHYAIKALRHLLDPGDQCITGTQQRRERTTTGTRQEHDRNATGTRQEQERNERGTRQEQD